MLLTYLICDTNRQHFIFALKKKHSTTCYKKTKKKLILHLYGVLLTSLHVLEDDDIQHECWWK